ncbi:portal protein [Microbacterium phage Pikmin]|uniref:Portal protein n=3 Tax=Pikminvirus pikmin TaxID=2560596 RepID=A0A2P1CKH2_9CAUD|nr:portal protein [Microbacterium phage Pikmin]AVJ50994.1 portal protein [Microbacterium phage Pajaza]AVJ51141.1 portal protein [Microbacterium phage Pikmin]AVJ51699.1 portal protein [Microbacterium phage Casey]
MIMVDIQQFLLQRESKTYAAYYNGKMSYTLHGKEWEKYVAEAFPDLSDQKTSENIFKAVIDLYAENLVPVPDELKGFSNVLVPLLSRGECPVVVDSGGTPHFPEHYEMISDGRYTVAAIFTRSIEKMEDYVTFVHSDGHAELWAKSVPEDLTPATREGYKFVETTHGNELFRFALDDKGFGASMAALQDRTNHSIIDQTVIAEMYARPFWYLLNVELPPTNPYLPAQPGAQSAMKEQKTDGASGRIFTTSSEGPFGQLTPPTIGDMVAYHDSIIDKVSQSSGIPQHYFKPGQGTPPTGVALKVLSKRFNNKIARMREDLTPELERLAEMLGVERTVEIEGQSEKEYELWNTSDDLLQESMDAHGIALSQIGYPLEYIAEVVTPGVDLDDYMDDGLAAAQADAALPTPDQVAAYAQNPGQKAGQPAMNPLPQQASGQ